MKTMPTHQRSDDRGFTLIELMVVVLIVAILLAIAIPTFLGAQNKAKDRSAQSSARNALTNAKTLYADAGNYTAVTNVALTAIEPALTFVAAGVASAGPKSVSVSTSSDTWYGAVLSDTGTCFYIRDSIAPAANPGTSFAKAATGGGVTCTGTEATTAAGYAANW